MVLFLSTLTIVKSSTGKHIHDSIISKCASQVIDEVIASVNAQGLSIAVETQSNSCFFNST